MEVGAVVDLLPAGLSCEASGGISSWPALTIPVCFYSIEPLLSERFAKTRLWGLSMSVPSRIMESKRFSRDVGVYKGRCKRLD